GVEDWMQKKVLVKPANQLVLNEEQLNEDITRILNANSPHVPQNIARFSYKEGAFKTAPALDMMVTHFEFEGFGRRRPGRRRGRNGTAPDAAAAAASAATVATATAMTGPDAGPDAAAPQTNARNPFIFSERASQTLNLPLREQATNTVMPPFRTFSDNVNQWSIYDAYMDDLQAKERAAKTKAHAPTGNGGAGGAEGTSEGGTGAHDEPYYRSAELKWALTQLERMTNQNTFDEITQDYKFWDDAADEMGDRNTGSLLPLWKFVCEHEKKKQVTSICWNPGKRDLFAVGYGSFDFSRQGPGILAGFTLKNPSHPEYLFYTPSGIMSLDFHPTEQHLLAVGLYDGTVRVYTLQPRKNGDQLVCISRPSDQHSDPVWQLRWQRNDLDDNLNFFSVSTDGRIRKWTLVKNELFPTTVIHSLAPGGTPTMHISSAMDSMNYASSCCFDFHPQEDHLFLVGTEEGWVYECSKLYNRHPVNRFLGHQMAIHTIAYNPVCPDIFCTASADWTVKIWDRAPLTARTPLLSFDLGSDCADMAWSPVSPTILGIITTEGRCLIFDLAQSRTQPLCDQQIARKAHLTQIRFNPRDPIVLIGDDRATLVSAKLSPNLRRVRKEASGDPAAYLKSVLGVAAV
ncbi:hypothetical protein CXG81DRAFT_10338, partial [Caulochytrium protostelioides]